MRNATTAQLETTTIVFPRHMHGVTQLLKLDETFIGTDNYMGLAYFWNTEYKHDMRSATPLQRVEVHNAFTEFGLDLDGKSDLHEQLVAEMLGNFTVESA